MRFFDAACDQRLGSWCFFRGSDPAPVFFFLEDPMRIRMRVNSTRIRNHALIYPDNITIILTFIANEKKS